MSKEVSLAHELIDYYLHKYIYAETDEDSNQSLFNDIGIIVCAMLTVRPNIISAADVELMSSSLDALQEVNSKFPALHEFHR